MLVGGKEELQQGCGLASQKLAQGRALRVGLSGSSRAPGSSQAASGTQHSSGPLL